jgi:HMG (high mobility group) box
VATTTFQVVGHHDSVLPALSAYNFFFRDERDRIVESDSQGPYDTSASKKHALLSKKRRHRKTHGKIAFQDLAKLVSKRWRALPDSAKEFYRDVAASDMVRYRKEVQEQNASIRTPN